ncbi:cytochrome b5 reductase [Pseudozyma hubeiensis SY62]|uniref:Cytochrome b5 reductase n=1 Tax=Pseudozyma hubeiensis (strain SY62) TaxID=1305764 RepID=R9PBE0_PSEHS|nr:cytochrome b5 reductase [Pseudozyma hubeiensis SY62]GAC95370.1 cytochrome b5 reductase [Pseudozyma hubeiensis SY62]
MAAVAVERADKVRTLHWCRDSTVQVDSATVSVLELQNRKQEHTEEAETAKDGTGSTVAWGTRVVADGVRNARDDPSSRDDGGKLGKEETVEEGQEGEAGEVFERVLVYTLGAADRVIERASPVGVEVGVGDLSSFARAADLDTHEEGDPDGRDDARDYIAVSYGQEETLYGGGLGSEKVVERRDGGAKSLPMQTICFRKHVECVDLLIGFNQKIVVRASSVFRLVPPWLRRRSRDYDRSDESQSLEQIRALLSIHGCNLRTYWRTVYDGVVRKGKQAARVVDPASVPINSKLRVRVGSCDCGAAPLVLCYHSNQRHAADRLPAYTRSAFYQHPSILTTCVVRHARSYR